jgi:short-subunit dehydrogenase
MRKLVVVTGGTKGIGRAIVDKFSSQDFNIVTCSRNLNDLRMLKEEMEGKHDCIIETFQADLSDVKQVKNFSDFIGTVGQPVEVLVNNAGLFIPGEVISEEEGNLEKIMNANLFSAYHLTRSIVGGMINRKKGHIFNMCSIASFMAYPNGGAYTISKFALLGFSKCLRAELVDLGVRVTAVMPGATYTDSWAASPLPEERFMPSEDIATLVFATYSLSGRSVVEDIIIRPQMGDL